MLLDDARRLADGPVPTFWDSELTGTVGRLGPDTGPVLKCAHCRQKLHAHLPRCPWLAMPMIVAALEAADDLVMATIGHVDEFGNHSLHPNDLGRLRAALDVSNRSTHAAGRPGR